MTRQHAVPMTVVALWLSAPLAAQDAPATPGIPPDTQAMMAAYQKAATPGAEHARLASTAGVYDLAIRSWYVPGAPPVTDTGTATRTMVLGGRAVAEQVDARMIGQPFSGQGLHGFDNVTGTYWATWADNMGTGLMVSQGRCDADMACAYTATQTDPVSREPQTLRMTSRWTDDRTELFEMYMPGPDGTEHRMMEITYTRRGP